MKYVMTEAVVQEGMALLDQEDTVYVAHDANPANYTEEMKCIKIIESHDSVNRMV